MENNYPKTILENAGKWAAIAGLGCTGLAMVGSSVLLLNSYFLRVLGVGVDLVVLGGRKKMFEIDGMFGSRVFS